PAQLRLSPAVPTRRSSDLVPVRYSDPVLVSCTIVPLLDESLLLDSATWEFPKTRVEVIKSLSWRVECLLQYNHLDSHTVDATLRDRKSTRLNSSHVKISYA